MTIWDNAKKRYGRYEELIDTVLKKVKKVDASKRLAELEGQQIRAIVDFEVANSKKDSSWTFRDGGIGRLADDFFLLNEYITNYNSERVKQWCTTLGRWAISAEEMAAIDKITDEKQRSAELIEKIRPILQPVWSFFVALCHALQEGENELTPTDAYWLGLVDEVVGEKLLTLRVLEEVKPEPAKK